jgi:hypothetical protein
MLDVEVSGNSESIRLEGLVDSGTDITMMDSEVAKVLGIDPTSCKKGTASGVGGEKPGFLGKVRIKVPGFKRGMTTTVLFIDGLSFPVILGQDDFFRNFLVRFDRRKQVFSLKPSLE